MQKLFQLGYIHSVKGFDLHEDGGAAVCNYTNAAVVVMYGNVVSLQKTFVSCPVRAMRRLFSAPNEAFRRFLWDLDGR